MAACFRHLLTLEEDRHSLARKALDDLARGDPHREDLRLGIDLTHELRVALGEKRWDRAREMLVRLRATDMPIIPQLVQDWDTALSQVAEAIGHRRVRQYQEALTGLEGAIAAIPDVFIGRPAPTPAEMREELQQLRDVVAQEMQALTRAATTPAGPSATARRPTISSDGGAKVGGAIVFRVRSLGRTAQSNYARLSRLVHDNEPHPGGGLGDQFRSWLDRLTERLRGAAPKRPFDESEPAPELVTSEPDQSAPVAVAVRTRKRARHPRPKPQTETSRSSGDLWESASWAMGGALMVGVVTLLFALNSGMRSADRARVPLPASATGQTIGRMVELLRANDVEAAAALLVRVRAEEPSRLTVEQQRQLDAVSDCIWLWERQEQPASALQREDLARLNELWVAVQSAEGRQSLEAVCPPGMNAEESIRAQAGARWEQLQLLMRQDSNEAYEAIVAALDGLQDASLSILCGGDTVFRETLMRAHAGLARRRFEAYACEAGSQQIGDILQLLEGHQELARLEELRPLNGLQERCWRLQEDCKALARLQSDDGLTSPGDDLLVLANLEPRWDDIRQACGDVSLQALVKNRLDALWKMVEDGDIARARVEALKLAGHEWFVRPPAAQHSPAVISVAAAALLVEQECDRGGCGQEADDVLATAQRTYEGFSEAMSPEVRERLMELMQEARARCETCEGQLAAAPAAPTPTTPVVVGTPVSRPPAVAPAARTLSLLDPDLGGWKDVGVYFGTTEHGRVWYLYDRFVKTYAAPLLYDSADQDRQYQLYRTEYQPSERQLDAVTSIRVRSKVLSIKESLEDTKPLWGIRMAGSGDQAVYLLIMWGPGPGGDEARGAWALSLWSPGSEGSGEYGLPPGPSGVTTEIRIERAPDGSAFDVYWQDELALAQQPLPAPGDLRQVEFLVGEGVHIWLRAAEIGLGR